ncbi:hypothetical protein FDECE_5981 [Fusarium decemcellulare]|nr:hypothetical protein FDECE_5981 [Fusarium decemcellulare]
MAASPASFLSLALEIREMIYDLVFEQVEFSNLLTSKTAYTPTSCPLLYVHPTISNDLLPRLYKNHAIVIPIQEPCDYTHGKPWLVHHLEASSRMMKQRSDKLIVEASQTKPCYSIGSDGKREKHNSFWDDEDGGGEFAKKLIQDLLSMNPQLSNVSRIEFFFWCGDWYVWQQHWEEGLKQLREEWDRPITVYVQLNLFGFEDPECGDMGSNFVQCWHDQAEYDEEFSSWLDFAAIDLDYAEHQAGKFEGRNFDPTAWEDPYFLDREEEEQENALHCGVTECRPLFVKTGPGPW